MQEERWHFDALPPQLRAEVESGSLSEEEAAAELDTDDGERDAPTAAAAHAPKSATVPRRLHVDVDVLPEEDHGFTLWVRELDIGASGATMAEARQRLLDAVRSYVRNYFKDFLFYQQFEDMAAKKPYMRLLALAQDEAELALLLFGPTSDAVDPAAADNTQEPPRAAATVDSLKRLYDRALAASGLPYRSPSHHLAEQLAAAGEALGYARSLEAITGDREWKSAAARLAEQVRGRVQIGQSEIDDAERAASRARRLGLR